MRCLLLINRKLILYLLLFCFIFLLIPLTIDNDGYTSTGRNPFEEIGHSGVLNTSFVEKVSCEWRCIWGGNKSDIPRDMAIDKFNNIYITGETYSYGVDSYSDIFLLKYNSSGDLLWNRTWGTLERDFGTHIAIDSRGFIYVAGIAKWSEDDEIVLLKYDPNGDLMWNLTTIGHSCSGIVVDSNDNVIIAGTYWWGDYLVLHKYSNNGSLIWFNYYTLDNHHDIWGIELTSQDNICMLGTIGNYHYLLKFDNNGVLEQNITMLDGTRFDITIDNTDMIYITIRYEGIWYLVKYDRDFMYLWNITLATLPFYYDYYRVSTDSQRNIYVGGKSYILMKFNSMGEHCWNFTETEAYDKFEARKIAFDSDDNIYCIYGSMNVYLIKYDNSDHSMIYLKSPKFPEKYLHLLIVGVEDYPGNQYDLTWPEEDVKEMVRFLRNKWNIPNDYIHYVINGDATKDKILNAIKNIQVKIKPEEEFLFYYSGHGGGSAIYPYDTIYYNGVSHVIYDSQKITSEEFEEELDSINCSRKYVFMDACESGDFSSPCSNNENIFYMLSCRDTEVSIETYEHGNGAFTYYFLESFDNANDEDLDDFISLEEQYSYLYGKVSSYASQYEYSQHPVMCDGISGDTFIGPVLEYFLCNKSSNKIFYKFKLYGSGQVYDIYFKLISGSESIIVGINDSSVSNYGFGISSGVLNLNEQKSIKSIEIIVEIAGHDYLTFSKTFYFQKNQLIPFSNFFLIPAIIAIIYIITFIIKVKKIKFS